MKFNELGLKEELCLAIKKEKIHTPTEVQSQTFKKIKAGGNYMVHAQTGTGKTLAYLLPLMEKISLKNKGVQVLVVVPTHELAMQVHHQVQRLAKNSGLPYLSAAVIGNVNIERQIQALKKKPQIVIGTSGRILELLTLRKLKVHTVKTLVLDEADKLLDKDHVDGVKKVMKSCLRDVQLLMFSASSFQDKKMVEEEIQRTFEVIQVQERNIVPEKIKHFYFQMERRDKIETLRKLAKSLNPKKAIIFINKVSDIEEMTQKLQYHKYQAKCIHGTIKKQDRQNIVREFENGKLQFLVATDIAARGIDFKDVDAVFHISIPEASEDYLHRAGRTGRNGQSGLSVLLLTEKELSRVKQYQKDLNIQFLKKKMYQGKVVKG